MAYGLDMSVVRYITDDQGKRLDAVIPVSMFPALTAFWIEARRAETARIEAKTPPRAFRGSLYGLPSTSEPQESTVHTTGRAGAGDRFGRKWADLVASMPGDSQPADEPVVESAPLPAESPPATGSAPPTDQHRPQRHRTPQVFFAREFVETPPGEIIAAIKRGVYFLRAWRDYRQLTRADVAELFGKTPDTINCHENGYSRPRPETLARFAEIFDCPLAQIMPRPGSEKTRAGGFQVSGQISTVPIEAHISQLLANVKD